MGYQDSYGDVNARTAITSSVSPGQVHEAPARMLLTELGPLPENLPLSDGPSL